ncbi:N-acetylmuramoyl-L-alanine amidase family protein [Clostridium lundense]|uniref:N-acetylmuramoyl-L-alanine amidase family protein n=1 Tax=Clostridium lundense TaxID=319475 RepID=UPI0004853E06|nr:N-acetylmuramoyl-L-alanine amidase [Clostridium lundense]
MRRKNKERLLVSCIFFNLLMVLFVNCDIKYNKNILVVSKPHVVLGEKKKVAKENLDNLKMDKPFKMDEKIDRKLDRIIVVDPGHGGVDKGTNIGNLYEKNINLAIASYTKSYLQQNGFKVYMTREEDKLIPLKEIGNFVNDIRPEVFVSIHVNSFKENKYEGISTYYYDPNGFQREERIELAKSIQKQNIKDGIWHDRGILRQNIAVLRYSNSNCVLVECGFITNEGDRKKLQDESILKSTGENIAKGIINYINNKN